METLANQTERAEGLETGSPACRCLSWLDSVLVFAGALLLRLGLLKPGFPPAPSESGFLETAYSADRSGLGLIRPVPADPGSSDLVVTLLAWIQPLWTFSEGPARAGEVLVDQAGPIVLGSRLLFAVCGALACVFIARAAARLGGRGSAWMAGGLMALTPFAVGSSPVIGPASLLFFAGAGAFASLVWLSASPGRRAAAATGAFAGLGAAVSAGAAALLLALPLALRGRARSQVPSRWLTAALAAGVGFALGAPGAGLDLLSGGGPDDAARIGSPLAQGVGYLWTMAGPLSAALALVGLVVLVRRREASLLLGALALGFFGTLLAEPSHPAGLAIVLPGVLLLAALGATAPDIGLRARRAAGVAALLVALIGTANLVAGRWSRTPQERAEEWVRRNLGTHAPILIEAERVPLARVERAEELERQVAAGEARPEDLERYSRHGKLFQLLELPGAETEGAEGVLRYDPDLARHFPWVILQDIAPDGGAARREFHAFVRSSWAVGARFKPGRTDAPGVTIFGRTSDFEPHEARREALRSRLDTGELASVRDTSQALLQWQVRGGAILRSIGEFSAAKEFLLPAAERDSSSAEAQFQLGLVHLLEEQYDQAKERFLLGMLNDPSHGAIHYNLGTLLEKEGDLRGAETEYRAATILLDSPAPAHAVLGALLAQRGEMDGAAEQLRMLREIEPGGEPERMLSEFLGAP